MIRIYKHSEAPESLSRQSSWGKEDVVCRLAADQHDKCYLCERRAVIDFQVDHLRSRTNYPDLVFSWPNLIYCCSYCNAKKNRCFDQILNPFEHDIENLIIQKFDFPNSKVIFRSEEEKTEASETTIRLLSLIFNGSGKLRTHREQQFYNYAHSQIISFQNMVLLWLREGGEEIRNAIIEELDIKSEFLGFKYWIIRSNPRIFSEFSQYLLWNKSQLPSPDGN